MAVSSPPCPLSPLSSLKQARNHLLSILNSGDIKKIMNLQMIGKKRAMLIVTACAQQPMDYVRDNISFIRLAISSHISCDTREHTERTSLTIFNTILENVMSC